jgi:hypothetical protein
MVGVDGNEFTVTTVPAEDADVQPPLVTLTVYVPAVETVIDWVVAPLDQVLPLAEDDVNVTDPPVQNAVGPPAVIVGVDGKEFTVTTVPADEVDVQPPLVTLTVYVPPVETVMDCVVAPLDQVLPFADDDVNVTDPPEQNVVGPPAVIIGVDGNEFTVTTVPAEDADVQPPLVTLTVYVPAVETVMDCVVAPLDQVFPLADDDVNVTEPPVQNVVGPPAVIVGVVGKAFTVTFCVVVVDPLTVSVMVFAPEVE